MLTDDLIDVFIVDGSTQEEVGKQLIKFKESVKIVNTFHPPSECEPFCNTQTIENKNDKSILGIHKRDGTTVANGLTHSVSAGRFDAIKNPPLPAISVVAFR